MDSTPTHCHIAYGFGILYLSFLYSFPKIFALSWFKIVYSVMPYTIWHVVPAI